MQCYRFRPEGRRPNGKLFQFFDRFVVTWLFAIFDILILLPALVWIALVVAASVLIPLARILAFVWGLAIRWIPWLVDAVAHWLGLLSVSFLHYLNWLQHVG